MGNMSYFRFQNTELIVFGEKRWTYAIAQTYGVN